MKKVDIMEAVEKGVESVLFKQWKHDGYMDGWNSEQVAFVVDGKRYVLEIKEAQNG